MKKILVLRGGALGDFIVTLPALALLKQRWPEARIELAGNATAAELGRGAGLITAGHSQHDARWSALYADAAFAPEFSDWLAQFDLVLNFWPDPDGELGKKFPRYAGQLFISANALPLRAPAAAHYCAPLERLGLRPERFIFPLGAPNQDAQLIAIHAGSGSPGKNWPLERWTALGVWLRRELAAELLIVSGEAESPELLAHLGAAARSLPLPQLMARFAQCRLFLGHDSGVSHLAAACGVPGVLLFGPTDPAMWAPPTPVVRVIRRGNSLDAISLSDVQEAVLTALADRS